LVEDFNAQDRVSTVEDIEDKFNQCECRPSNIYLLNLKREEQLTFSYIEFIGDHPKIISSLIIDLNLKFNVSHNGVFKNLSHFRHFVNNIDKIDNFTEVLNLLAAIKSCSTDDYDSIKYVTEILQNTAFESPSINKKVEFLIQQLILMKNNNDHNHRYSQSLLVSSFTVYSSSANAYRSLLGEEILSLPSEKTLRRLFQKISLSTETVCDDYLKVRSGPLNTFEKNVILIIDEVYIAKKVEYSAGKMYGLTSDGQLATTVLSFMIKSLASKYRDIVALYPVCKLTANKLADCFDCVIKKLTELEFSVVAILVDNHPINRSFYVNILCNGSIKSYIMNPYGNGEKIFLLFDTTHNVKNIYNNFERKKNFEIPSFPGILSQNISPDFSHCVKLYELEKGKPIKYAHKLRKNFLNPKSIEKVSVKPASAIFSESTSGALRIYGKDERSQWNDTAIFIEIITKLWNVLNVKTTSIGKRKRDPSKDVISSILDWKIEYLEQFCNFLENWKRAGKGLTKETFFALSSTISSIIQLSIYLLSSKGFNYVRLGSIQSDALESRFGWYRNLSGSNYYISLKDVLHNERKIKLISLLKHSNISVKDLSFNDIEISLNHDAELLAEEVGLYLGEGYIPTEEDMGLIAYVGGYISHKIGIKKCLKCKVIVTGEENVENFELSFITAINRGGLSFPSQFIITLGAKLYSIFYEIIHNKYTKKLFFNYSRQQSLLFLAIFSLEVSKDSTLEEMCAINGTCEDGHDLIKPIVNSFFNCFSKNFANDESSVSFFDSKLRKISSS